MKQKVKWALDAVSIRSFPNSVIEAQYYKGWLAGFEFAKEKIRQTPRKIPESFKENVQIDYSDVGEEEVE